MNVVVVESPAKAKTIEKYLGPGFTVLASYGHVRDLPSKDGSVRPDQDFAMLYETEARAAKNLKAIADALKGAKHLFLATDPDREGEAISWHVLQSLTERKAMKGIDVKRIVFNEITKTAILEAMKHPRDLDMNLVNAQQARRALDYLVGFTLSPVLWRKLPGARSAGRVQSVALRLVCEREIEIEAFKPQEYWTIEADFLTEQGVKITTRLVQVDGKKVDKFDLADEASARAVVERAERALSYKVSDVAVKPAKRHPAPPFTTSTLQQEASRKLGFGAQHTMSLAQRLYEGVDIGGETVGLISYMRTDGVTMANEAITGARNVIGSDFGAKYVPEKWRIYKAKTKNAQEAHEAIRPTDFARRPDQVAKYVDAAQLKLYELIWKRALASQMESADLERTTVDISDESGALGFRVTGSVVLFPGFLKLYEESFDDVAGDEEGSRLPKLSKDEALKRDTIRPEQHFTEPPPRFTEASLVKKLEELGIGRPSTYASILEVLRERSYVRLEKGRFIPDDKGRVVTAFLVAFFERYFAYGFTADLEEKLDEITENRADWKQVLRDFWRDFSMQGTNDNAPTALVSTQDAVQNIDKSIGSRTVVIDAIDEALGPHFFPDKGDGANPRACPACANGRLGIKFGRNGAFVGCSNYPECRFTRALAVGNDNDAAALVALDGPKALGDDPATGLAITLRNGPYGPYVQLGEPEGKEKPKRASLPKGVPPDQMDLPLAIRLLAMPRVVGEHPESKLPIVAGLGRFGPYLLHDGKYVKLASAEEALDIGLNRAVDMIAEAKLKGPGKRGGQEPLRVIGAHPVDGEPVSLMNGRYGPYLKHGKTNAPIPKTATADNVTLEAAVEALNARAAMGGGKPKGRAAPKARAKPKTAVAKAAAPKAAKAKAPAKVKAAAKAPAKAPRKAAAAG